MKAIKEIVEITAEDPPIAMVSRFISSFNKVSSCRRRKNEELFVFASRFRCLAAEHQMHANSPSSSQIGEVLSITVLNNGSLEEGTLTQAKLNFIQMAEQRASKEDKLELFNVLKSLVDNVLKAVASLENLNGPVIVSQNPARTVYRRSLNTFRKSFRDTLIGLTSLQS